MAPAIDMTKEFGGLPTITEACKQAQLTANRECKIIRFVYNGITCLCAFGDDSSASLLELNWNIVTEQNVGRVKIAGIAISWPII
jgi:hypothetical protein